MSQAETAGTAGGPSVLPASSPLSGAGEPARPRRTPGPSVRPALVVVGVALVLVLLFGVGAALTRNPSPKERGAAPVAGTGLVAEPATATLHPIEILGTPPADVLDALVLPKGSHAVSAVPWKGSTQYAGRMTFRVGASQGVLVTFFRRALGARGWSIVNVGAARAARGATEVLAQRASSDGWFWEAGVVVFPTSFGTSAAHRDATRFSLDLYEMPDAT
ncbi:MAG TPA: hypothetical protein VND62_11895 [Acidimicrobiales bacterium]|nr:hypothetical protein [Acidimicrobiales bacterium]